MSAKLEADGTVIGDHVGRRRKPQSPRGFDVSRPTAEKATKRDHVVGTLDACTDALHSVNEGIVIQSGQRESCPGLSFS